MTSSADVIILSSSPNTSPLPTRVSNNIDRAFEISSKAATPFAPSLAASFLPPSRSRFFDVPTRKDDASKKKQPKTKKATSREKDAPSKTRQKANKVAKEPTHNVLGDLDSPSLESKKNVAKKPPVPQKSRAKPKAKKESGNLKLAGKVTKGRKDSDTQSKPAEKTDNKTVAHPVDPTATSERAASSNALGQDEVLHLDEAVRRRREWTPPRETSPQVANTMDNGASREETRQPVNNAFGGILTDYNYSGSGPDFREASTNEGGPTKRRRIELVDLQCQPIHSRNPKECNLNPEDTSSSSGAQPKRKVKAQKRFTTLTARMTAQYTSNDVEEDASTEDITQFVTQSKSRGSKKKSTDADPDLIVLSPETASKALDQQDVVFGTWSQLERDDSPETLREMQGAIRASESLELGQTARSEAASGSMSRLAGARNLWSIAGRDTEGSLVQAIIVDNVDLTDTSIISEENKDAPKRNPALDVPDDEWLDLDEGKPTNLRTKPSTSTNVIEPADPGPPTSATHAQPVHQSQLAVQTTKIPQQTPMPQYDGFTDAELSRQVAAYGFKSVRGRKKMIELLQKCWKSKHGKAAQPVDVPSQTSSPSLAEGAAAVPSTAAAPSSKPKSKAKTKTKSITSTSTPAKHATRAETIITASPKRNQQKPSRVGSPPPSSYIDIEEIQDSEEEVFLSPSQVQKRYTEIFSNRSSQVSSLEILTKDRPQTPSKSNTAVSKYSRVTKSTSSGAATKTQTAQTAERTSLLDISTQITKAVRAQPKHLKPSNSRSRPTWHEKILMYDPIVLEDFTSWLNVEGLGLVGEDREIGTAAVREWCEAKGICCCWKKNANW